MGYKIRNIVRDMGQLFIQAELTNGQHVTCTVPETTSKEDILKAMDLLEEEKMKGISDDVQSLVGFVKH